MNLLKGNISNLVKKLAIPASVGTLFQTLFNIVDTFFAGKISPEALSALAKSFPIYFIIIAACVGVTVGGTSLIANSIVLTCTGSIAIERSLQGLKTVICGYPWFGELPGTIRIEDINWTNNEELNSLKDRSLQIKTDSKLYLSEILSYGLVRDISLKNRDSNFKSMKEFLDSFLEKS